MSNLDKALALGRLGLEILPCRSEDKWLGGSLQRAKSPLLPNGLHGASSDEQTIRQWFNQFPDAIVGVVANQDLIVLDIDVDTEKNVDGFFTLEASNLVTPESFGYATPRGGRHIWYKPRDDLKLGPMAPVRTPSGSVLDGVDRRSQASYFIFWGSELPLGLETLASPPQWLLGQSGSKDEANLAYSKGLTRWLAEIPDGPPSVAVLDTVDSFPSGDFGHTQMLAIQRRLVGLAARGETGVAAALFELRALWLHGKYATPEIEREWNDALEGAVEKFGRIGEEVGEDSFERLVDHYYLQARAKNLAEARLASESHSGTDLVTWGDLEEFSKSPLVEDLIPEKGIGFLVAKPNIGKTLAYIDLACRAATGASWLGKKVNFKKTLIVLGEGIGGFLPRVKAWADANGADLETLQRNIAVVNGASLTSNVSCEKLALIAKEFRPELIVFDTYSNTSGTPDEDKAALNALVMSNAEAIFPEATVMFVHHPRKQSEHTKHPEMRGSSALRGRADFVIVMIDDKDSKSGDQPERQMLMLSTQGENGGKSRDFGPQKIRGIYLADGSEAPVFTWTNETLSSHRIVRMLAGLGEEFTVKDLVEAQDITTRTAERYVNRAREDGHIVRLERKSITEPYRYRWAS